MRPVDDDALRDAWAEAQQKELTLAQHAYTCQWCAWRGTALGAARHTQETQHLIRIETTAKEAAAVSQPTRLPFAQTTTVFSTEDPCHHCGIFLLRLKPPVQTWHHYCRVCEHLTEPQDVLDRWMQARDPQSLGVVVAVPMRLTLAFAPGKEPLYAPNR